MKIGIDISQIVYAHTGVAHYMRNLVQALVKNDRANEYVLFGSSLRKRIVLKDFYNTLPKGAPVSLILLPLPPVFLDFLWNRVHIVPVEWFIGEVDIFWSSDWTQPPLSKAFGIT